MLLNYIYQDQLFITLNYNQVTSGTWQDSLFWGFICSLSLVLAAIFGAKYQPGEKSTSYLLAFTSGVLIALLSYDLMEVSFNIAGVLPTTIGFFLGIVIYILTNRWVESLGCKSRHSSKHGGCHKKDNNPPSYSLLIGALIDGIPEAASIGISLLENKIVSASVIVAVALANIPEGLASGAGLRKSGFSYKNIILIWSLVVIACTLSSFLSYTFLKDVEPYIQAALIAFAGGGVLAMTLQTVIPEAYKDANDFIGLFGGIGFLFVFLLAHLFSH